MDGAHEGCEADPDFTDIRLADPTGGRDAWENVSVIYGPGDRDLERLDEFARAFVAAAMQPSASSMQGVTAFPRAMCTWASFAGGELLSDAGFGRWTLVNARQEVDQTRRHDWLVQDDVFVDLTAHQFADFDTHIVGRGDNPVSTSYPVVLLRLSTSGLHERQTNLDWARHVQRLMGGSDVAR